MRSPPLIAGAIYGLRCWSVGPAERLTGIAMGGAWNPDGPTEAGCHRGHPAPASTCACGLYALHPTRKSAADVLSSGADGMVAGIVAAWGAVDLHASGFRAQWARVHALVLPQNARAKHAHLVRRIAAAYGVDVLRVRDADELLRHCRGNGFGLDDPVLEALLAPLHERARRARRLQLAARAGSAVACAAAVAGALKLWPVIVEALRSPPPSYPSEIRWLTMIEQQLLDLEKGDSLYVAVVRNDHPTRAALGVFAAGRIGTGGADATVALDARLDFEHRPVLAPRQEGVLFDVLEGRRLYGRPLLFDVRPLARAFRTGPASPVSIDRVRFDRRRCLVTARVRSDRARVRAGVVVLGRGRDRAVTWYDLLDIGPLPRGASRQVLARVWPDDCAKGAAAVSAYPDLTVGQVVRQTAARRTD